MNNPTQRSIKSFLAAAALILTSMVLTVIAAEVCLRIAFPVGYFIWKPHLNRTFHPVPGVMPGVAGESRFQTNSRGLRADEIVETHAYRILTLGGSTTECLYLDQAEAWPQLLQETLNGVAKAPRTWVGNAGMSGRNSRHHLMALRHIALQEVKIDAVVLLAGVNDLSIRLSQGDGYDPLTMHKPEAARKLVAETFTGLERGDPRDPWIKRTVLWQLLRGLKNRLINPLPIAGEQDQAGVIYRTWRKHRQEATNLIRTLPDLTSSLDEYARNVKEMAELARAKSVRLIVVTQPTMWRPGLPDDLESLLWFGGVGDFQVHPGQPYYSVDALAEGIKRYNDVLLQQCASERIECIDLSALEKDTTVFYDDVHFNEAGSRKVARIISDHLKARAPFVAH